VPTIPFENATLITNVDLEDITVDGFRELTNMREINGRLVKTFGFGSFIPDTQSDLAGLDQDNLFTYIETNLTSDKLYIIVDVNSSNEPVMRGHDDSASDTWVIMNTGSDVTFNSMTFQMPNNTGFHHKIDRNPFFQLSNILRLYPGNIADADAEGIWLARIDRDYYDALFTPTLQFYGYGLNIQAPSLTVTPEQLQGGSFSPDSSNIDTKYYKFSNIYDGIQESLLGTQIGIVYNDSFNMFGKFTFNFTVNSTDTFDVTKQSNRITAMNMYRADDADADYKLIQVIDFLRPVEDKALTGASTGVTGQTRLYIPGLATEDFTSLSTPLVITLTAPDGDTFTADITSVHTGFNNTVFDHDGDITSSGGWNDNWRMVDGAAAEIGASNLGGAYGGMNAFVFDEAVADIDVGNYAGGVIEKTGAPTADNITVTSGTDSKVRCTFINPSNATPIDVDDIVIMSGFTTSGNEEYNGTFKVTVTQAIFPLPSTYYEIGLAHNANEAGKYIKFSLTRIIDENVGKAVHSADSWGMSGDTVGGDSWTIMSPVNGLFSPTLNTGTITYEIYDTNLTGTTSAPLQGEASIDINARFVIEVLGRTFHFNGIINPTSTTDAETQEDWLFYSELDQPDVVPSSNQFRIADREGGEGTGLARLYGNVVCMKKKAIVTLFLNNDPANPSNWNLRESAFNIGNVAPQGFITVNDATLYLTALDGIYRLTLNDLAEANQSSVKHLRISEPINDIFEAMTTTQREGVETTFEPIAQEVYFKLGLRMFAWSVQRETWREIVSSNEPNLSSKLIFALDEDANVMMYNDNNKTIFNTSVAESIDTQFQTKTFVTNDIRASVVRYLNVTYKSSASLTAEIYTDKNGLASSDTALQTVTLTSTSGAILTKRFRLSARAKKYNVRIISTAFDTTDTEIHKLFIGNEAR